MAMDRAYEAWKAQELWADPAAPTSKQDYVAYLREQQRRQAAPAAGAPGPLPSPPPAGAPQPQAPLAAPWAPPTTARGVGASPYAPGAANPGAFRAYMGAAAQQPAQFAGAAGPRRHRGGGRAASPRALAAGAASGHLEVSVFVVVDASSCLAASTCAYTRRASRIRRYYFATHVEEQ